MQTDRAVGIHVLAASRGVNSTEPLARLGVYLREDAARLESGTYGIRGGRAIQLLGGIHRGLRGGRPVGVRSKAELRFENKSVGHHMPSAFRISYNARDQICPS